MMNSEKPILTSQETQPTYRAEIELRLTELGWTQQDMDFPAWSPQRSEWIKLVEPVAPMEMDDEAWNELQPKLIHILITDRESRLRMNRDKRRTDRYNHLSQLFSTLKNQAPPLVSFEIGEYGNPGSSRTKTVSQKPAFPAMVDTLQWPVIKSLLEADMTTDELEQIFGSRREEIDTLVTEWRDKLHSHMVDLIPRPEGEILCPTLAIGNLNPFKDLSDDLKLLLRADSLFLIASCPTRVFTYKDILRFTNSDSHSPKTTGEKPLDIESISVFPWARGAAQVLLKSMGCPDVSYLELEGEWVCGRCHDTEPRTWTQMVEHYVQEQLFYFTVHADVKRMNIPYNDVHDPALFTDRPMIMYWSGKASGEELAPPQGQVRQCRICIKNPIRKDVRGWEGKVLEHLLDVHGIRNAKFKEHYGSPVAIAALNSKTAPNTRDSFDDENVLDDDGSETYDFAECEMVDEGADDEFDPDAAGLEFGYDPGEWGG